MEPYNSYMDQGLIRIEKEPQMKFRAYFQGEYIGNVSAPSMAVAIDFLRAELDCHEREIALIEI